MTEITQLLKTIKYQLKQQAKTYRDVAAALNLSRPVSSVCLAKAAMHRSH